jgi:hypothetical protein
MFLLFNDNSEFFLTSDEFEQLDTNATSEFCIIEILPEIVTESDIQTNEIEEI